jgi:4-azaleucine resistance transporter AzlC
VRQASYRAAVPSPDRRGDNAAVDRHGSAAQLLAGLRAGLPVGVVLVAVGASFGAVAHQAGLAPGLAVLMSALVYSASAQFAAVAIFAAGGGLGPAVVGAALMNSRYLPMGMAVAPSLPGGPLRRALQGLAVVDAAWALAARGDGSYDRWLMFGSSLAQYVAWVSGTLLGAFAGSALSHPRAVGLDAAYPAFFLALLISETHTPRRRVVALLSTAIALALTPIAPPGVPILAASVAALVGVTRKASRQ